MNEQAFYLKLMKFINVLQKEQQILQHNQPEKLAAIVTQKQAFVEILNQYAGPITVRLKNIMTDIRVLQEQNLLLTQMEMSYQKTLMNAVRESVKISRNPYGNQVTTSAATLLVDTDM